MATCTAIWPALPVAPRTSTLCPGEKLIRWRSATQLDMAGFIAAAIVAGSASGASVTLRRRSITVCCAMLPQRVSGRMK